MPGNVYTIPPQPPVAENTRLLAAGAITFGVEYRDLDPASLEATYADDDAHLTELREKSPEGGFADEGVSIHVCGTDDGHEYVRFDVFEDNPHYHYNHRVPNGSDVVNNVIDFDAVAEGDMLPWAIERIKTRLAPMLIQAGGAHLVPQLDTALIAAVLDDVQAMAGQAQEARRKAAKK